jgi:hypothetical protein
VPSAEFAARRRFLRDDDGREAIPAVASCKAATAAPIWTAKFCTRVSSAQRSNAFLKIALPVSATSAAVGAARPRSRNMAAIAVARVDSLISSRSPNSAYAAMTVLRLRAWPRRDSNHGAMASNALVTAVRGATDVGAAPDGLHDERLERG